MSILERIQADTAAAMKAGDRARVGALRLITDALQKDAKEGEGDEVAVLRRERKRRIEAADAYKEGGSDDRAASEQEEARLIEDYLPEELPSGELGELVKKAIDEAGAESPKDMGKVMAALMPKLGGRVDGKRASEAVREQLGS
jgi:uncharacterized protein